MKSIFTFVFVLLLANLSFSQDIIAHFEDAEWQTSSCGSGQPNYLDLLPISFWANLNPICKLGSPIITVTQTTDAVSGKAALLRTQVLGLVNSDSTPGFGGRLIPGLINSGVFNSSNLTNPLEQGRAYTGKPSCMRGYYKYFPILGDSAALYAVLRSGGVEIARAAMSVTSQVSQYTAFDIPFVYTSANTPDSINIVWVSSSASDQNKGRKGSRLYIDEMQILMSCPTSISNKTLAFSHIAPNPVKDRLAITLFNAVATANLVITNLEGKAVASHFLGNIENEISVENLPKGIYFYQISDQKGNQNTGKFIKD